MILSFSDISFSFLGRTIIENLSFDVGDNEILGVLGPSGVGKTTVLQLGSGLYEPTNGKISRRFTRQAVVFQEPRLLPWKTTFENIGYGINSPLSNDEKRQLVYETAGSVGLTKDDLLKYPAALSGGMRQRVSVARALAVKPEIVFFDEPFSAVDIGLRRILQNIVIAKAAELGFAAVFITHDLHEVVRLADRLILLGGEPATIVANESIGGVRGNRSERDIFGLMESFENNPKFRELLVGREVIA